MRDFDLRSFNIENTVLVPTEHYEELVAAKTERDMLKAYLLRKRKNYSDINRQEVDLLCAMFKEDKE